jgi:hypothetical protein
MIIASRRRLAASKVGWDLASFDIGGPNGHHSPRAVVPPKLLPRCAHALNGVEYPGSDSVPSVLAGLLPACLLVRQEAIVGHVDHRAHGGSDQARLWTREEKARLVGD